MNRRNSHMEQALFNKKLGGVLLFFAFICFKLLLMNPKSLLLFFLFAISVGSFGQDFTIYRQLVYDLDSLMQDEQFEEAAVLYDTLFANYDLFVDDGEYINGAEANVMAGRPERACDFLEYIVFRKFGLYTDYEALISNLYLMPLQGNERWNLILERVQENYRVIVSSQNEKLKADLEIMYSDYLAERSYVYAYSNAYGDDSKEVQLLRDSMVYHDSINQIRLINFIEINGVVSQNQVGTQGIMSFFMILNIADTSVRINYLPLIEEAFEKQKISARSYANFIDILQMDRGFYQIYGTRFEFNDSTEKPSFLPVQNPETLEERRAEIGLMPMKKYARLMGLRWGL